MTSPHLFLMQADAVAATSEVIALREQLGLVRADTARWQSVAAAVEKDRDAVVAQHHAQLNALKEEGTELEQNLRGEVELVRQALGAREEEVKRYKVQLVKAKKLRTQDAERSVHRAIWENGM
jgi:hypothetical protein